MYSHCNRAGEYNFYKISKKADFALNPLIIETQSVTQDSVPGTIHPPTYVICMVMGILMT